MAELFILNWEKLLKLQRNKRKKTGYMIRKEGPRGQIVENAARERRTRPQGTQGGKPYRTSTVWAKIQRGGWGEQTQDAILLSPFSLD